MEHESKPLTSSRIQLALTHRYAMMVVTLCRREMKKRMRTMEKEKFIPEAGKFDANRMYALAMQDIINQLEPQLGFDKMPPRTTRNLP